MAAHEVREQGSAQVPDADEGHVLGLRRIEEVADALKQLLDVVAPHGTARIADGHDVAPDLRGRASGHGGELVRIDVLLAVGQ